MHIHLDTLGGISGNMFIGAMLDIFPHLAEQLPEQLMLAGYADLVTLDISNKNDGVLQGKYFSVVVRNNPEPKSLVFATATVFADTHTHRAWREIKATLSASNLTAKVKKHALGIFTVLANAEAAVHGVPVDEIEFHEVGAWDSIADVVCAAFLIEASEVVSWSVSNLPLGRGLINSAHGFLPVPAPAVAHLLKGYFFHDDGLEGERITPTGAAILAYLSATQSRPNTHLRLLNTGHGFGSRSFSGVSNVVRAMLFSFQAQPTAPSRDAIACISFEVDDQSAEDLALALEYMRKQQGVIDVVQYPVMGKKNRQANSVRVLVQPEVQAAIENLCFTQTTTLGLRCSVTQRTILQRQIVNVGLQGRNYRVKLAQRPDGELTAKAELDDLTQTHLNQAERQLVREIVEAIALDRHSGKAKLAAPNGKKNKLDNSIDINAADSVINVDIDSQEKS
ncbi:MAG: LarC family nickel insertion protein [Pseudohongiellaceae bacterium]